MALQVREDLDQKLPPRPYLPPMYGPLPPKPSYTERAVLGPAFQVGLVSGGVGMFISSVKNSLEPHNKGALGVFTRTGWIIGLFATAGFTYKFVNNTVANMRESATDGVAGAASGCASGFVMGIKSGSLATAMATCGVVGAAMATFDLAGGKMGYEPTKKDRITREQERLQFFKKRSLPETAAAEEE